MNIQIQIHVNTFSFTDEFGAAAKALNVSWEEGEFCATFVDQVENLC